MFIAEAKKRPEIANAFTLYRSNVPQKQIVIDYDKAEKLNIDLNEITSTISTYLGSTLCERLQPVRTSVQSVCAG
jgi:HAE1 family hydrophobic/amphiphilic exporter-1